jgi:polysaccharide biosynthesis transport protein
MQTDPIPVPDPRDGHDDGLVPASGGVQPVAFLRNQQLTQQLNQSQAERDKDELDLLAYWRVLVKRRWTVLATLAIVLATTLVATLLMTPIYRATTVLQIDRDTIKVVDVEGMAPVEGAGDRDFYQTQYELLQSRGLAERAMQELGLGRGGAAEAKLLPPSAWDKLRARLSGAPAVAPAEAGKADPAHARDVLAAFRAGLVIEPVRNSRLVRVHYDSPDRNFSQRAADVVAEAFIASNLERRFDSSSYAKQYLEERLQELKLKLEDSERKLVEFAQKERIVEAAGEGGNLSQQSLSSINAALAKAKEDRIRAEARWRQAQASGGAVRFGDMGATSIIQSLQESRAKLMAEYQDKLRLYKPAYPLMQQLKGQIEELDKQLGAEMGNIRAGVRAEYQAAVDQESLLAAQLDQLRGEALDLQNRSIQYNIFKREVDTNRQLYDGLLQRYKEIGVAGGVSTNNISIADRADLGAKFKPSLARNLGLALLAGLFLGVLFALAFEHLDDTLKSPEDIEQRLQLGVLGVIPKLKQPQTPRQALEDLRSAFSESYRSLRTALQFSTESGVPRCLLVTSSTPSEGKSTTAMVLAQNFAQLGKSVLLIDCDLRNPSLHRQLELDNTTGLTNYLVGSAQPEDVALATRVPKLSVITSGPLPPNPAELLLGPRMLSLLTVAVRKYDQVIIDGPPVMGLADAPILANMASGTLLVVEAGETRIAVARNALKRLFATRSRVVGALLTKFEANHVGYGYGYGDYNYYSYGTKPGTQLART